MLEQKQGYTVVKIDNDDLLDMLVERVKFWRKDDKTIKLYEQMYQNYIDAGVFNETVLDIMTTVDNDVVNYTMVFPKNELSSDDWDRLKKDYENGDTDISCKSFDFGKGSFIEVMNDEAILIRS